MEKIDLHSSVFSMKNKLLRVIWGVVYIILFRFTPKNLFGFRRFILKCFGSNITSSSRVYPSCKIWLPSNLTMGDDSTLGPKVNCYNQGHITIKNKVIISQGAHLCASTHNYNDPLHPLLLKPITIEDDVWVCADAFIGPGVHLANGSVIGARAVATKNTESWTVYSGNPAKPLKKRSFDK